MFGDTAIFMQIYARNDLTAAKVDGTFIKTTHFQGKDQICR